MLPQDFGCNCSPDPEIYRDMQLWLQLLCCILICKSVLVMTVANVLDEVYFVGAFPFLYFCNPRYLLIWVLCQVVVVLPQTLWMSQRMHIRVPWTLRMIRCSQHIPYVLVLLSITRCSSTKYRMLLTRHASWLNRFIELLQLMLLHVIAALGTLKHQCS